MPTLASIELPIPSAAAPGAEAARLTAAPAPLHAIMRRFEFICVATTAPAARSIVPSAARRVRPSANQKSRIQNRKF
ncbi:MAG: hypothetical protein HYV96_04630 [Opitutae bacterium]|nr:hypothetical protein [Opitutae bacterium]